MASRFHLTGKGRELVGSLSASQAVAGRPLVWVSSLSGHLGLAVNGEPWSRAIYTAGTDGLAQSIDTEGNACRVLHLADQTEAARQIARWADGDGHSVAEWAAGA